MLFFHSQIFVNYKLIFLGTTLDTTFIFDPDPFEVTERVVDSLFDAGLGGEMLDDVPDPVPDPVPVPDPFSVLECILDEVGRDTPGTDLVGVTFTPDPVPDPVPVPVSVPFTDPDTDTVPPVIVFGTEGGGVGGSLEFVFKTVFVGGVGRVFTEFEDNFGEVLFPLGALPGVFPAGEDPAEIPVDFSLDFFGEISLGGEREETESLLSFSFSIDFDNTEFLRTSSPSIIDFLCLFEFITGENVAPSIS